MDKITEKIREMYELFPYPAGGVTMRLGADARLLLSYGKRTRQSRGPLHVLDAGCGRGIGLLGCAVLQPDVQFLGIDINRVALKEAADQAAARGLKNVRFMECDLMTLEGLTVPEGGFDIIYSSGVLHHLSDPAQGLRKLKTVCAPHGLISFMVYASYGRQPLYRMINGARILLGDSDPVAERLQPARALVESARDTILKNTPWYNTPDVSDVEFVDRCLNPNETSYDIDSMWTLFDECGMRFIRWLEPDKWSVEKALEQDELLARARTLSERDQYRLIEQICWRPSFQMVISHAENSPRPGYDTKEVRSTLFAVNPEVSYSLETRSIRGAQRIESLSYRFGRDENVRLKKGPMTTALMILKDQNMPFIGESLIKVLADEGVSAQNAIRAISELVELNLVYRPHLSEA
ncbi:MAG: class I SAM-dependent methyltransferase [Myxococcota bacterium]|nr:class I SAM-dependent methyltransferase [Myxococcota bacterium]